MIKPYKYIRPFLLVTSIKKKLMLIIMSVSTVGLCIVGASILVREVVSLNKMQQIDMQVLAEIMSINTAAFLMFDDAVGAERSLSSLRAKKQVTKAVLFDKNKHFFAAHFAQPGTDITFDSIKSASDKGSKSFYAWNDVIVDDELVGYLYVEMNDLVVREFTYGAIATLITALTIGFFVAYLIASRMQKIISEPVEHLTKTASQITSQQNYNLRAEKESEDEIGVLTGEFNKMLSQLQRRNIELLESENKFREVVEQSVDALFILNLNGDFVDVNNAACESLGYARKELLSLNIMDVDTGLGDFESFYDLREKLHKEKSLTIEGEQKSKSGELKPVETRLGFVNISGAELILASVSDITERKIAQLELQKANDLLEIKVNERTSTLKSVNAALSVAKERAEAANKAKSMFLANMSHEIRTPMNAVVGFTDVLASSNLTEQQMGYVKSIQSGSRNLLSLINDILDLSKIEAGKLKIQLDEVYVRQMLEDIKQVFFISAEEKGLIFELKIDESVPDIIMSDEVRLRQILFNLVNNAVKFTRKGKVQLLAEYTQSAENSLFYDLLIMVKDTGIGIAEDSQVSIFNIFEQQDNQSTREFGGAGLGLAISSRLAENLNSELSVESEKGLGSCFKLLIRAPEIVELKNELVAVQNTTNVKFKKAKILIVDDIAVNRELIEEYLLDQDFDILHASDGIEGIAAIRSEHPDLVLMDVRMPRMDGIEATNLIKSDPEISATPIVAVTASVVIDGAADKKRSVFDYVLYKPLSRKKLNQCLQKFLKVESYEIDGAKHISFSEQLKNEMLESNESFVLGVAEYEEALSRSISRGSFGGLDQLLEELCEMSTEYDMSVFKSLISKLREANDQFDIGATQKYLTMLVATIQGLKERCNG